MLLVEPVLIRLLEISLFLQVNYWLFVSGSDNIGVLVRIELCMGGGSPAVVLQRRRGCAAVGAERA